MYKYTGKPEFVQGTYKRGQDKRIERKSRFNDTGRYPEGSQLSGYSFVLQVFYAG
jgi:hypothetical protein